MDESRILMDFPDHFYTEHLLIRAPHPGDGPALNAAVLESLHELRPWMIWAQTAPSLHDSERNVREAYLRFFAREDLRLHIFLKDSETFVGSSGLHRIDWAIPKFEIGYWCRTSLTGRGYVTEAVKGITRFAFDRLSAKRVEIRCDYRNQRSRLVAERAGYTLEAELKNASIDMSGYPTHDLLFRLVPSEYRFWIQDGLLPRITF